MYSKVLKGTENGVHCASDKVTNIVLAEMVSAEISSADAGGGPALYGMSVQNLRTLNSPNITVRDPYVASGCEQRSVCAPSTDIIDDRSYRDVVMSPAQSKTLITLSLSLEQK